MCLSVLLLSGASGRERERGVNLSGERGRNIFSVDSLAQSALSYFNRLGPTGCL